MTSFGAPHLHETQWMPLLGFAEVRLVGRVHVLWLGFSLDTVDVVQPCRQILALPRSCSVSLHTRST